MMKRLEAWLGVAGGVRKGVSPDDVRLATAALLIEAARLDGMLLAAEQNRILELLCRRFGLSSAEAGELLAAATVEQARSNQLVRFTRIIKDEFSPQQRIGFIEMLWEVAYADGHLHPYEANLLRRVAGLIYVPDQESGAARKRVMARLGLAEDDPAAGSAG